MAEGNTTLPEEALTYQKSPQERMADEAVRVAIKQLETGAKSRDARFAQIAKFEAQYRGEKTEALRGRNNVPFDAIVGRGFVDTLHSKIDEPIEIEFRRRREQDKKSADKMTAAYLAESAPDMGAWNIKVLGGKKLAIFSGRGIFKKYSDREGGTFKDHFEIVDHWDFITEPQGGGFLDKHLFKGQMNIFRSEEQIWEKAKAGIYNKRQAQILFKRASEKDYKTNQDLYTAKIRRSETFGFDFDLNTYIGSKMHRLTEWVMYFRGDWYNLVFQYDSGIWLRFEKLSDVYSVAKKIPGRGPWCSFPTHFDPFDFWSIGPYDSIYGIGYTMKKIVNSTLDNVDKRNWDQRAYDPKVFTEPKQLMWKQDGLVKATLKAGQSIGNHLYRFETPDTTNVTINLMQYFNGLLGENTGITAGAKGKADEEKATIYVGNIQQVADRLGLLNKMYEQMYVDIGVNFKYGMADHAPEKYVVKLIGAKGTSWDEDLRRDEANLEFSIAVKGTNAEMKQNEALAAKKANALATLSRSQLLISKMNQNWLAKEILQIGGYGQEEVRIAMDTLNDADEELLSEAAQAIQDIVEGKNPKSNRGATTGYIAKIIDFAHDSEDLSDQVFNKLVAFARKHIPIAQKNMVRRARAVVAAGTGEMDKMPGDLEQGAPALPGGGLPGAGAGLPSQVNPAEGAPAV